ncbi:hypothetical protein Lal_00030958 [Lupinus albus]|nr:hypothetical protein Lal_00030958 [Lupinus albus]
MKIIGKLNPKDNTFFIYVQISDKEVINLMMMKNLINITAHFLLLHHLKNQYQHPMFEHFHALIYHDNLPMSVMVETKNAKIPSKTGLYQMFLHDNVSTDQSRVKDIIKTSEKDI